MSFQAICASIMNIMIFLNAITFAQLAITVKEEDHKHNSKMQLLT